MQLHPRVSAGILRVPCTWWWVTFPKCWGDSSGWGCLRLQTSNQDLSVTLCVWFDLICYRKVTHSYMRLLQALLKKSSQDISSQVLLWKLLLSSGFHRFIILWVVGLFKYHIQCNAVNKGANSYITMIPRREWSVKRRKCLFCHSWITNIPINCFSGVV